MKPAHIFIFIIVLFTFGIIFYSLQRGNINSQQSALDAINNVSPTPAFFDPQNPNANLPAQNQQPNQGQVQGQTQNPLQQQQQPQQQESQEEQVRRILEEVKKTNYTATIKTSKGDIKMELYGSVAPITVYNFVQKANTNFYNNLTFHRVEDWVIQGGDPKGDGTGGGQLPTEFNDKPFIEGSLGSARANDPRVQNDSQFFITKTESPHLNGQYTNYGQVTEGMDVVNKIAIGDKIVSIIVTKN